MPTRIAPIRIPDEFAVWVGSDFHGQRTAVERLLADAGLVDSAGRWAAPPKTALVVTGDMVDRGPDSVGLVRDLVALRDEAAAAGGMVALLEGNHEVQVLGGLLGAGALVEAFWRFGGAATLLSAGLTESDWANRSPGEVRAVFDAAVPGFLDLLWSFAPYARWRDVLFVHGGPVPSQDLAAWEASAQRLWIRKDFFASEHRFPGAEVWLPYRRDGIRRVVFGHTPVPEPTLFHGNLALNVDTWKGSIVSLARMPETEDLRDSRLLAVAAEPRAMADPPSTPEAIRGFDAGLPGVVDAWWEAIRGPARGSAG